MKEALIRKIRNKQADVGVIGLGYVGLPLAVEFAKAGFSVTGFDIDKGKIESIKKCISYIPDVPSSDLEELVDRVPLSERMGNDSGIPPEGGYRTFLSATDDFSQLESIDVVVICVPTPLKKTKDPDIQYIVAACEEIAKHLHSGMLISLESSTYPGTTDELMLPMFERSDFRVGEDFFLCFSPERVDPGNAKYHTRNIPKIVGGITAACTEVGCEFYQFGVDTVVPVDGTRTAEMVKLLENTFRMVNIGLVNELAIMCDKMGINIWDVIEAAKTKPFGFMPFFPGGVGGHCIPIDPYYLSWKAKQYGGDPRFIETAGWVNSQVPDYVVGKLQDFLNDEGKPLKRSTILLIGIAYKKNVSDVRESPAIDIASLLLTKGAVVHYYDPYVKQCLVNGLRIESVALSSLYDEVEKADCVLITADHDVVDYERVLKHSKLLVDPKNAVAKRTQCPPLNKSGHCVLYKYQREKDSHSERNDN